MSDMNASEDEGVYYDSEFNLSDDDFLYDDYVDPYVEFGGSNKGKSVEGSEWCGDDVYAIAPAKNIEEEGCVHSDDDFASTYGSDDEENMKYQMYNPRAENKNRDLKLGLIFSSKEEAKFAIQSHCLRRECPEKNKKTKPTRSTRIASVKINQSTSNIHTPVIVRGVMNFITLSNLRASFSNVATGNTSRVASEMPPGVSRNTSRVPSGSSRASQSNQQG
ncbi:hypothetical protein Salat_1743700 [Sesamum alatum]|uniref:Uncharacterized protein n=1 Tax=Sesamum alatum TaxID=300844 RepID=A0AAE1Y8L7_9LAMI|nr:hypothetical protein Salat_1743700 [Sesamum alatum]